MLKGTTAEPIVLEFMELGPGGILAERRARLHAVPAKELRCELSGDLDKFGRVSIDVRLLDGKKAPVAGKEARVTDSQRSITITQVPAEAKFVDLVAKCLVADKIDRARLIVNCTGV